MADILSGVKNLFASDPRRAIDFMLEHFQEIRDYTGEYSTDPAGDDSKHGSTDHAHTCDSCAHCGSKNSVLDEAEGDMCCLDCGTCWRHFDNTIKAVDYQEQVELGAEMYFLPKKTEYKRMQHFCDLLNQLQDKRDVRLDEDLLRDVKARISEDFPATHKPTLKTIRTVLKKIGVGYRQYENAQAILNKISKYDKKVLLEIPHDVERRMKGMFMRVEHAWKRCDDASGAKASRKSFLSYSYVIKQLLRILGHKDLADRIPTIKSKARIRSHDEAWKSICKLCKFEFEPLV